jgi:hypothetical protein
MITGSDMMRLYRCNLSAKPSEEMQLEYLHAGKHGTLLKVDHYECNVVHNELPERNYEN